MAYLMIRSMDETPMSDSTAIFIMIVMGVIVVGWLAWMAYDWWITK